VVVSCTTVPKSNIQSIEVPPGLTDRQGEFGILAALADQPPPEKLDPSIEITDRALEAWFGFRYSRMRGDQGQWYLEARDRPNRRVVAGHQRDQYYIRLELVYDDTTVRLTVASSRNLDESSTRIHGAAIQWIQELEMDIRRALGQLSVRQPQPQPQPAGP
jgi:hypothetical protein